MPWQDDMIPKDVTYGEGADAKPIAEHPFVKEAPDFPTFLKHSIAQHQEVGARIPVRIDKNDPKALEKWRTDHMPKLYDAGILPKPITDPKAYEIKKPDDLTPGVNWSDERANKFAELGVKYNVSKEAMNDFLELHRDAIRGTQAMLKTNYDETMLSLKREFGDKFDASMEDAKRLSALIFKSKEEIDFLNETGVGDHPLFLGVLMRLAPYAANDSTLVEHLKQSGGSVENNEANRSALRAELADIQGNPQNPKHERYMRGDKEVMAEIDAKYKALYGDEKIEIGSGVIIKSA